MPDQDFSAPEHRLDNLSTHRFFRVYALLRENIHSARWADAPVSDLREVCALVDSQLAKELGIPATTLIGRLVDLGAQIAGLQDGQEATEKAEG